MQKVFSLSRAALFSLIAVAIQTSVLHAQAANPQECTSAVAADANFGGDDKDAKVLCEKYAYEHIACAMKLTVDEEFLLKLPANPVCPKMTLGDPQCPAVPPRVFFHGVLPEALEVCQNSAN